MKSKNFHFKLSPSELLSELIAMSNEQRGEWITRFAIDLVGDNEESATTGLAKRMIAEANEYRELKAQAGSKGGIAKASRCVAKVSTATFCSSTPLANDSTPLASNSSSTKKNNGRFSPPDISDVVVYCRDRNKGVDPHRWFDFYASKGWMIGKNTMKDWRAAVRTWEEKQAEPVKRGLVE